MNDKTVLHVTVTLLSPLHVGSGERLREGFDFIEHEDFLWVANQGALWSAVLDRVATNEGSLLRAASQMSSLTLNELQSRGWLQDDDFSAGSGLFHYCLAGRTSTAEKQGEVLEQIKDVYGRPYLPGSSFKGALRTLIAWHAVHQRQLAIKVEREDRRGRRPRFPALAVERNLFGRNPNYDLLRALQVSDSAPVSPEALGLATVRMFPPEADRDKLGIDVEALVPGTQLTLDVKLDGYLLGDRRAEKLDFANRRQWLANMVRTGRRHARQRVLDEITYYQAQGGAPDVLRFYAGLAKMLLENELAEDEFLLQVGWGAGWDSKTLGSELRKDSAEFASIVDDFRLALGPKRQSRNPRAQRAANAPFPATRKLASIARPAVRRQPMGWMKVKLKAE